MKVRFFSLAVVAILLSFGCAFTLKNISSDSGQIDAEDANSKGAVVVTFYTETNYGGSSFTFSVVSNIPLFPPGFQRKICSFKATGCKVLFFDSENFRVTPAQFFENGWVPDMNAGGKNYNRKAMSAAFIFDSINPQVCIQDMRSFP